MEYISNSPAETEALGEALAARLTAGTVVAFTEYPGAGDQPHLYHCQRI